MVFNIGRYQIPYIEYSLFKSYIAKNLCVKKDQKNNCCQGKCFLKKQIKLTEENENSNGNDTKTKNDKSHTFEVNEFVIFDMEALNSAELFTLLFFNLETAIAPKFVSDIFVPPKQTLLTNIYRMNLSCHA